MGAADPRAQIVWHHQLGTPAVEFEGAHVRCHPVRQGLRTRRLGEGVARGPEHGHEDLRLTHLAGSSRSTHRHRLPGVVDEQLSRRRGAPGAKSSFAAQARYCSQNRLYCNPSGWVSLYSCPTATTASRSCAATPGAPRSSPAADAPCGSAATPETAGAPGGRRRPTRAAANSAPPPWPGAGSRPPSTATYPGCGRWLGCSTPRRSTAAAPLEFLPAFGQPPARQAFVPSCKVSHPAVPDPRMHETGIRCRG